MTNDFHDFAEFPPRWERPRTSLGRWSLELFAGFTALMSLFIAILSLYGTTNEVILTCTAAAFGSAFAAGIAAIVAIKRKDERSILMVLPLILGGIATMAAFAVIVELVARASAWD